MDPYVAQKLPIKKLDLKSFIRFIGPANQSLKENNLIIERFPEALKLLAYRDAVLSSKIEHYTATATEVIAYDNGYHLNRESEDQIVEVVNLYRALEYGMERVIDGSEVNLDLICNLHSILMSSPSGQEKSPGKFRDIQNWIGIPGTPIEEAFFVPPEASTLKRSMKNFEKYLAFNEVDVSVLVALVHAQFQIIHPFEDGNGRVSRALVPLLFYQKKAMTLPCFFMSEVLLSNVRQYYGVLTLIVKEKDWDSWIIFFLLAIQYQEACTKQIVQRISNLKNTLEEQLASVFDKTKARDLLDKMFGQPVFGEDELSEWTGSRKQSVDTIRNLDSLGIISSYEDNVRDEKFFGLSPLLEIIDPIRRVEKKD